MSPTGIIVDAGHTVHQQQRWVLRVDIKDFFPSINFGRVRGIFLAPPFQYPESVATLLAKICIFDNEIPQGAPTSPLISNLTCRGLDRQLSALAREEHCYYSRYCDDLIFSTNRGRFPQALARTDPENGAIQLGKQLKTIVEQNGFELNEGKTMLRHRSQRQMVTGLVVNSGLNVPRAYVRSLRNLLYIWRKHGLDAAESSFDRHDFKNRPPGKLAPEFPQVIRGKVQYVGAIKGWQDPVYRRLALQLSSLDKSFTATTRISDEPPVRTNLLSGPILLFAEGKTDYIHFKSALRYFQTNGQYRDLDIEFAAATHTEGDQGLLGRCRSFSTVTQIKQHIFVFDHDTPKIIKAVTDVDMPFKAWGNNVFSLTLPSPPHRKHAEHICVELLYADDTLSLKTDNDLRMFQINEFNLENGFHNVERYHLFNAKNNNLIPDKVMDEDGKNVSLSKSAFAAAIHEGASPFTSPSFEGFRPLFDVLSEINNTAMER